MRVIENSGIDCVHPLGVICIYSKVNIRNSLFAEVTGEAKTNELKMSCLSGKTTLESNTARSGGAAGWSVHAPGAKLNVYRGFARAGESSFSYFSFLVDCAKALQPNKPAPGGKELLFIHRVQSRVCFASTAH